MSRRESVNAPAGDPIERFRAAIARLYGLQFEARQTPLLVEILEHVAGSCPDAVQQYLNQFAGGGLNPEERTRLLAELTVGESHFFRHIDHFHVLTDLMSAHAGSGRLNILSAGCSCGEEPYSIALLVRDRFPHIAASTRILGIDVNPVSLGRARRGRYSEWSLRGLPEEMRERHFRKIDREYLLDESIRSMVVFEERNLAEPAPDFWQPGRFDLILCRNVMMYFGPDAACNLVARLTHSLRPGGHLFLSPAETLRGISTDYQLRHTHETFYYVRKPVGSRAEQPSRSPEPPARMAEWPTAWNDVSWFGEIGKAAERIARLQRTLRPAAEPSILPLPVASMHEAPKEDSDLLRAILLANSGRFAEAKETCGRLLAGDGLNPEAHHLIALCHEHAGEPVPAAEHYEMAVHLAPEFALPRLRLGVLLKRSGILAAAGGHFRDAARLLPGEASSRILLFADGFDRDALIRLARTEAEACGEQP